MEIRSRQTSQEGPEKINIEEIFASIGRTTVLHALIQNVEMNISAISKWTGLNYANTLKHLTALEKVGFVEEKTFGRRIRIFRLREENPRVMALKKLVDFWENRTLDAPFANPLAQRQFRGIPQVLALSSK